MSHLKEREQKNCLNCNAQVTGRFCSVCGQENTPAKETIGHLFSHYFQDITHFDGKFFSTLKELILQPGFLSTAYLQGKRTSFLNPIRMYVFTSAIFFLVFFTFVQKEEGVENDKLLSVENLENKLVNNKAAAEKILVKETDSAEIKKLRNSILRMNNAIAVLQKDTLLHHRKTEEDSHFTIDAYPTIAAYDSAQAKLSPPKKDNWLKQKIHYRMIATVNKYKGDTDKIQSAIIDKLKHYAPQFLFLSLPFFALILQVLYSRHKQYFYVNHIIFSIHLYCAAFIMVLAIFGLNAMHTHTNWAVFGWLSTLLSIGIFFYQYKSMRYFYQQKRLKTIAKFILLTLLMWVVFVFLMATLFIFSAYQI